MFLLYMCLPFKEGYKEGIWIFPTYSTATKTW